MGEQGEGPRRGDPGRRPARVERDGTPRRELAHWLRAALTELGEPTLDTILRRFPDDVRLSRSALAKALRGETFPDLALVRAVLRAAGADEDEIEAWSTYWRRLHELETRRRRGETVTADPPPWAAEGGADGPGAAPAPSTPTPAVPTTGASPGPSTAAPSGAGEDPGARRRVPVPLVAAGALVLGAALALGAVLIADARPSARADTAPPSAVVLDPVTTTAPKTFRLVGSSRNLPDGTLLWATTYDPGTGRFFPQDKPCLVRTDGTFDCGQYYLGRQDAPDTATYRVDLFVAGSDASNALLQYQIDKGGPDGPNPGIPALPAATTVIGFRDYTRA